MQESSHEPQSQDKPTGEDLTMAAKIITPEWLDLTKRELQALPQMQGSPRDNGPQGEYEPGVQGMYLGIVDQQQVWAVDFDALVIKYGLPDLCVGANSCRWPQIPVDKIIIDWAYPIQDLLHVAIHELVEFFLMRNGWSYSRAHRYANQGPGCERDYLLAIRPELQSLVQKDQK
jgi:hypothetical protein